MREKNEHLPVALFGDLEAVLREGPALEGAADALPQDELVGLGQELLGERAHLGGGVGPRASVVGHPVITSNLIRKKF